MTQFQLKEKLYLDAIDFLHKGKVSKKLYFVSHGFYPQIVCHTTNAFIGYNCSFYMKNAFCGKCKLTQNVFAFFVSSFRLQSLKMTKKRLFFVIEFHRILQVRVMCYREYIEPQNSIRKKRSLHREITKKGFISNFACRRSYE